MLDPGTMLIVNWVRLYDLTILIAVLVLCFVLVGLIRIVAGGYSCRRIYAVHEVEVL